MNQYWEGLQEILDQCEVSLEEFNSLDISQKDVEFFAKSKNPIEDVIKAKNVLTPLNNKEELQEWFYLYFDVIYPIGVVYPTSTHGPVDAAWRIYELIKTGKSAEIPQVTLLSSRDSGKTSIASAMEVLCLIHFRFSIGHMAAILSQSEKAISYINDFFRKIQKYLEFNGWKNTSDSKKLISWLTDEGQEVYIKVIIATMSGANCIDPESIVETKEGLVKASHLTGNEWVLTRDFFNNKDIYVPLEGISYTEKESLLIEFTDGSNLITSTDHKIFTNKGWITADQLSLNSKILNKQLSKPISIKYDLNNNIDKVDWSLDQLILGTLLGDSSLSIKYNKNKKNTYRYQVSHCLQQRPYLVHIQKVLKKYNIESIIIPDSKNQYKLISKTYPIFEYYAKICYDQNHNKLVTDEWLKKITWEGWAYFYMDDGSKKTKTVGVTKHSNMSFSSCSFSIEENNKIINYLNILNLKTKIRYVSNSSKKKYPIVQFDKESGRKFSELINKWVLPIFKYKLLTPMSNFTLRHYIDTGKPVYTKHLYGFKWQNTSSHKMRIIRNTIYKQFNNGVNKITYLGIRKLIDLHVKHNDYNLQSFYANGILVHNSEHLPMLCIDEVDLISSGKILDEAKMIPSSFKNYSPLTVYLSTLKFAGGLMERVLKETPKAGGEILRWNIIDMIEGFDDKDLQKDKPLVKRYITTSLPMSNLSPEEWENLSSTEKVKYEEFYAYAGIAEHPLLSVMKHYPTLRKPNEKGGLHKRLQNVLVNFKQLSSSIEMADAQLLCNKPASTNLVYGRFDAALNVLTPKQAYLKLTGDETFEKEISLSELKNKLIELDARFIGGADWGFTDYTSLVVFALLPGGLIFLIDSHLEKGMEIDDIVKRCKYIQEEWDIDVWYGDTNYPSYLKTLRKNQMRFVKFDKDVAAGIAAIQSKVLSVTNRRTFFIIQTPETEHVIEKFNLYKWALDANGDMKEGVPYHDKEGVSDVMDSIRYPFQNLFAKGGKVILEMAVGEDRKQKPPLDPNTDIKEAANQLNKKMVANEVFNSSGVEIDIKKENDDKKGRKILFV